MLQSLVYLIGFTFCCGGATYLMLQKKSGKSVWSAVPTLDPETLDPSHARGRKSAKVELTPDSFHS